MTNWSRVRRLYLVAPLLVGNMVTKALPHRRVISYATKLRPLSLSGGMFPVVARKTPFPATAMNLLSIKGGSQAATMSSQPPPTPPPLENKHDIESPTKPSFSRNTLSEEGRIRGEGIEDSRSGDSVPPSDFGGPNGTCISNKQTILNELDEALGLKRPPDLEVILTDHVCYTGNMFSRWLHLNFLRFGHVAVRYTTKDGTSRVMNILGGDALKIPGARMVNFVDPKEFYYGTKGFDTYNQQGGAYNRDFVSVRIERVSEGSIDALHAYYQALHKRSAINTDHGSNSTATSESAEERKMVEYHSRNDRHVNPSTVGASTMKSGGSGHVLGSHEADKTNEAQLDETSLKSRLQNSHLLKPSRMGPGGQGRGAARFDLLDARLETFKRHIGLPVFLDLSRSILKQFKELVLMKNRDQASKSSKSSPLNESSIEYIEKDWKHNEEVYESNLEKKKQGLQAYDEVAPKDFIDSLDENNVVKILSRNVKKQSDLVKERVGKASSDVKEVQHDVREATSAFGNCAQWTSSGLEFAGFIPRSRLFPKSILIQLLESELMSGREDNVHVVVYKHVKHAKPRDKHYQFLKPAYTHPLHWVRNNIYSDMYPFATAVVHVPEGTMKAHVKTQTPLKPPAWQPYWQAVAMLTPTMVLIGAVNQIGPLGPAAAALWLFLNWWLH